MDRTAYESIISDLAAANEWLARIGIREQQDRIRKHIAHIQALEAGRAADRVSEVIGTDNGRLAIFSLTEALEFIDVYRGFEHGGPTELSQRIKDALDGSVTFAWSRRKLLTAAT